MRVLVVDVGGTHVKVLATGQKAPREFSSGPTLTAEQMVAGVKTVAAGWTYDVVSVGYPGPVLHGRPVAEPRHLGPGWVGFDYQKAFGCPVQVVNDAAMQALGSYQGGKMLFLGLGTGLGSTLIVDGIVEPMELGHLPYRDGTFEEYVGVPGLQAHGLAQWRRDVEDVVSRLIAALEPEDVVLGGGNVHQLDTLPPGCRAGDNANAFLGGFRLWEQPRDGSAASGGRKESLTEMSPLTARKSWKALQAHRKKIGERHLRSLFADDATRGERLTAEGGGHLSRLLEESHHRRDHPAALPTGRGVRPARPHRRDVPRRQDQRDGEPGRPPRGPAGSARPLDHGGRQGRRARGPCRPRRHGGLLEPGAQRGMEGAHRQAHPQRHQHRHRRLRPRPRDGLRGAQALQRSRADLPLRVERRRDRSRRGDPRPGPDGNALHRLVEDLHDAGDDDERRERAPVVARRARWRRQGGGQAFRGRLHERRQGVGVRDRHREHVRLLGLGGRALFHGLGHRSVDDARRRSRQLPRAARRLPPDGRALPHRPLRAQPARAAGLADRLVHGLLRRGDGGHPALRAIPEALSRVPAAADDGEQRQARHARRRRGRLPDRARLLGRAGHQRAAFLLPADPSRHAADSLRLHRVRARP